MTVSSFDRFRSIRAEDEHQRYQGWFRINGLIMKPTKIHILTIHLWGRSYRRCGIANLIRASIFTYLKLTSWGSSGPTLPGTAMLIRCVVNLTALALLYSANSGPYHRAWSDPVTLPMGVLSPGGALLSYFERLQILALLITLSFQAAVYLRATWLEA